MLLTLHNLINLRGGSTAANFAGTAAITFGQSGAFNAGSTFAGSSPVTFNQTANFNANSAFGGTAAITYGQTGALLASTALSGSSSIVFGQSGAFVAGSASAAANFSGTAAITFGQSATLVAAGQTYVVGGTFLSNKKRYRKDDDEQEPNEPEPIEIFAIGTAPNTVITGLVIPKQKRAKPNVNMLEKIEMDRFSSDRINKQKKRDQLLRDDEWFLLN